MSLLQSLLQILMGTSQQNLKVTHTTLNDGLEDSVEKPDDESDNDTEPKNIMSGLVERTYSDRTLYPDLDYIEEIRPGPVHLHGTFRNVSSRYARRGLKVTEGIFSDTTGTVRVVWFNKAVEIIIKPNVIFELRGNYALHNSRFGVSNPKINKLNEGCQQIKEINETAIKKEVVIPRHNIWTTTIEGKGLSADSKWQNLRIKVFSRDNYTCLVCGSSTNLTVDHIQPLKLGGTNSLKNLQTLCKDCHEDKHFRNFLDRSFDAFDDYGVNYKPTIKIKTLSSAMNSNGSVRISYTDRDGVRTYRTIHPKKIYKGYKYNGSVVNKNKVYVDAFCELDNAGRTFRVSRMELVK